MIRRRKKKVYRVLYVLLERLGSRRLDFQMRFDPSLKRTTRFLIVLDYRDLRL